MLNIFVAQVGLQRPGIVPPVGQRKAARMAQHVRMNAELELGLEANPRDHLGEAPRG